ncbi:MAG: hypothetical protein AMXMBFR4_07740 [Candidatus Hydrogenedentota bacterium]
MALSHERTFRVRHYECDAYQRMYYTNYLRYIQETAMDASAAAGLDGAWYDEHGFIWLVRETEIEFVRLLRYGDSARVKTWVKNMRQASSRRAYELFRVGDGQLAARAETDWAFLDRSTGRPARIPPAIQSTFFPEGEEATPAPRARFPNPPDPPSGAFAQRRRVEWRDIDPAQHVNNSVYLAYMEDCAVEAAAHVGWPPGRMRDCGFDLIMRRLRIEYKFPAVLGDVIRTSTWLSGVSKARSHRHFEIVRVADEKILARACAVMECVHVESGRPIDVPLECLNALAASVSNARSCNPSAGT